MHSILYFSIFVHYIVCCHLATANGGSAGIVAKGAPALLSSQHVGNDYPKSAMGYPFAAKRNHVVMRSGKNNNRNFVVNNKLGDEENSMHKKITPVPKAEESTAYNETNGDVNSEDTSVDESTAETIIFHDKLLDTLKKHLLYGLKMFYGNNMGDLLFFIEYIKIKQNFLNNSIARLFESSLDINAIMKLYLFLSGQFNKTEKFTKNVLTFDQQIGNIQKDIVTKFKDIIGSEVISKTLRVNELKKIKKNTEDVLSAMAIEAIEEIASRNKGTVLPGTPLHFICIGLLKWTYLMQSSNRDAKRIQDRTISLEDANEAIKQYVNTLDYDVLDIEDFYRSSSLEKLQNVNYSFLNYLYKYTKLLIKLIEKNQNELQSSDTLTTVSVTAQIEEIHAFFEAFNKLFESVYLKYVIIPRSQPKFKEFESFMFPNPTDATGSDSITSMIHEPQTVITHLTKSLLALSVACLQDLFNDDQQKWFYDVNTEIKSLLAANNNDVSSCLKIIRNHANKEMGTLLIDLNPTWPKAMSDNSNDFIPATRPDHKILP